MSEPPTTRPRGDSRWWFRPPRRHGEVLAHRTVSYLELFYDLVFVVLIAQISRSLAGDVTWVGVRDFLIVFALIWIAWVNGTLYHDLHGREDGRSRTYIFAQVSLLVLLSVFTVQAAEDPSDGRGFAIVFTLLVMLIAWQWFEVRRFDTPEWRPVAGRYVQGIVIIAVIVAISAALDNQDVRLALWGIAVGLSLAGNLVMTLRPRSDQMVQATRVTESLAERFGLFTIIVLGEVVVGVANGLAASEHDFRTTATGLIALSIGFGFWWNYFDFVGGRVPGVGRAGRVDVWTPAACDRHLRNGGRHDRARRTRRRRPNPNSDRLAHLGVDSDGGALHRSADENHRRAPWPPAGAADACRRRGRAAHRRRRPTCAVAARPDPVGPALRRVARSVRPTRSRRHHDLGPPVVSPAGGGEGSMRWRAVRSARGFPQVGPVRPRVRNGSGGSARTVRWCESTGRGAGPCQR